MNLRIRRFLAGAAMLLCAGTAGAVVTHDAVPRRPAGPSPIASVRTQPQPSFIEPKMVAIQPGSFIMGAPDEEEIRENVPQNLRHFASPQHVVAISRVFDMGKYLVTRAEFAVFVAATGYNIPQGCWTIVNGKTGVRSPANDWRDPGFPQSDRDPVVCVNHGDAAAYAAWLSKQTGELYRLPTEAEWEYAARAGTTTARYWGDGLDDAQRHSNIADFSLARVLHEEWNPEGYVPWDDNYPFTSPVGAFAPNQLGLYDMLGNAWEWTADCWNGNYQGAPADGSAWTSGDCRLRVLRGASWGNYPRAARTGLRNRSQAGVRSSYYGFRLARTPATLVSQRGMEPTGY